MEVKYLKLVADNPSRDGFTNEGMSEIEIQELERIYNAGKIFPQCLREYLFLAGRYSNFGFDVMDDIATTNIEARGALQRQKQVIPEPFFVVAQYGGCEYIDFVRLDTNLEDPMVYEAAIYMPAGGYGRLITDENSTYSLSDCILGNLKLILAGKGIP
jgi:hypothetical protein